MIDLYLDSDHKTRVLNKFPLAGLISVFMTWLCKKVDTVGSSLETRESLFSQSLKQTRWTHIDPRKITPPPNTKHTHHVHINTGFKMASYFVFVWKKKKRKIKINVSLNLTDESLETRWAFLQTRIARSMATVWWATVWWATVWWATVWWATVWWATVWWAKASCRTLGAPQSYPAALTSSCSLPVCRGRGEGGNETDLEISTKKIGKHLKGQLCRENWRGNDWWEGIPDISFCLLYQMPQTDHFLLQQGTQR